MSRPGSLRKVLTLRCEEASELISHAMDEPLPRLEALALWGHLLACTSCRRFRRQLRSLRTALRRRDRSPDGPRAEDDALSREARARIARAIDEADRDRP